ncbi:hypothetical protein GCM10022278_06040 [Allohahella marinimesophila]|uniref:Glutamate--cysteine ligase n=1 Tax=Allohahella marinimesophila TaxID=1054972 RepID=A0ABP7NLA3_9GAMM
MDRDANVVYANEAVRKAAGDDRLTLELNRFNLEFNLDPVPARGSPFASIEKTLQDTLLKLDQAAAASGAGIVPIGILPTLTTSQLGAHAMTDLPRYHALASALRHRRGEDFAIRIQGLETLDMRWGDVTLEGANTSFQFHYRVDPADFRDVWNTASLLTPLMTALAANSPLLFGRRLWQETRIPLFEQSVDSRVAHTFRARLPPRVGFGNGWLREGIHELFVEGAYLFPPLMPVMPEATAPGELGAMRLHQGSIWSWNRPIYDPADGGHIRIELRALPAGPTCADMCANAAVFIGLIEAMKPYINTIIPGLPFRYATENFYNAAHHGLEAIMLWPDIDSSTLRERTVADILGELLPMVPVGLSGLGVSASDIDRAVSIAADTLGSRQNGSRWLLDNLARLTADGSDKQAALRTLVNQYRQRALSNTPVSQWERL